MVADAFLSFVPGIGAQPEHVVVDKTSAAKSLSEDCYLLRCRVEPKLVRSFNVHT